MIVFCLLLLLCHLGDVEEPPAKLVKRCAEERRRLRPTLADREQQARVLRPMLEIPEAAPIPVVPELFPDPRKKR